MTSSPSGRLGGVLGGVLLFFSLPAFSQQWIGATVDKLSADADRSIILSKEFRCNEAVEEAMIRICGLGQYELYIDGQKANDYMFAPAWSDYKKTVFYNNIRLPKLTKGKHRIDVLLGNGFYHERGLRYHKLKSNYGPLTLWFRMNYGKQVIVSDESWKWQFSPISYNSIYGGEDCQGVLSFRKSGKQNVVVQKAPEGVMRPQLSMPVKIMESYPIQQRLKGMCFDMGQNLAGFPEIRVKGKPGQKIKIWVGESLKNDSAVSQKHIGSPHYYVYTIGSKKAETWHPHFSYTGFRYIQIDGAVMERDANPRNLPVIEHLQSDFIYNSAPKIGDFECSNPLFNGTYRIIDRAIRSNWQNVWTDCPHREKLGWLEQNWLNGPGLMTNYDAKAMIEQTMQVIADAQYANGKLPEIAPEYVVFEGKWAPPFQESPEWGGAFVALPFLYAEHYNDSSLIRQYLPQMRRYVDYLSSRDSSYILKMGLGDWYDYGPWKAGFARNTPMPLVATAHYYKWAKLLSSVDASYRPLADSIKSAFIKEYFHKEIPSQEEWTNEKTIEESAASSSKREPVALLNSSKDRRKTSSLKNGRIKNAKEGATAISERSTAATAESASAAAISEKTKAATAERASAVAISERSKAATAESASAAISEKTTAATAERASAISEKAKAATSNKQVSISLRGKNKASQIFSPTRGGDKREGMPRAAKKSAVKADLVARVGTEAAKNILPFGEACWGLSCASQTALSIYLDLGLYPEGCRPQLLEQLDRSIHIQGDRLTTGDIGTYYLFKVLIENGRGDLLYKMLNHEDSPGYGAQLKKGMTTLTEQWNPDFGASKNHFMLGHINNHLVQDMVGIHIKGDSIVVNPRFLGDITWAKGSTMTKDGKVSVDWKIKDGIFRITIITPNKKQTKIDEEAITRLCSSRNLKLQYSIRTE